MPVTSVYTSGVKYIKVAKLDSGSIDNSIQLQNLTDIRIKFTDIINPVQYNIASITEYPTYYLYTIVPLNVTSSTDQEILDYKISASGGSPTGGGLLATFITQSGTNILNYFGGTYLNMGNTPNVSLQVTFSLSQSNVTTTMSIYPYDTSSNLVIGNSVLDLYFPSTPSGYVTRSGSFTPIEGYSYGFRIDDTSDYFNSYFLITQSVATQSSNYDIVVLEPYVGANFYNSDCNVIQNNVDINIVSPFYMDVDFTNSPIVAQNQAAILNGTATRAQVKQWNYTYFSQISGRYLGKQQNAIKINEYTGPTSYTNGTSSVYGYTGSWPGDSISPSIPTPGNIVIQWLDSCIYEINWGGGGYPENTNGGGLNMGNIYLVGETKDDVAIIKPDTDIYYDILEKTFPSGSPAFQYQYASISNLSTQLNITYPALGLPSAMYYVSSLHTSGGFGWGYLYPTGSTGGTLGNPMIEAYDYQVTQIPQSVINSQGYLEQSPSLVKWDTLVQTIESDINNKTGRWFVSLYSGSGPTSSLTTGLPLIANLSNLSQWGPPFEITDADAQGGGIILLATGSSSTTNFIKYYSSSSFNNNNTSNITSFGRVPIGANSSSLSCSVGMLITKADYPNNGLTLFGTPSQNFGGTGQGYILSQYPKQVITENIDYILRTYGNKP